ncbi:hypothetical protein Tco_0909719 [Tanacetum coccineum]|uniref:Uncharacterized protein n=1 Tax=Tanacetum coccineum TaxID=301880 RepID=A0ABQ5CX47_9ASTR
MATNEATYDASRFHMANLSSTSATNNPVNEVHTNDNQIFDNVDYQLSQEMHQEEHLDSDAETEIDDKYNPVSIKRTVPRTAVLAFPAIEIASNASNPSTTVTHTFCFIIVHLQSQDMFHSSSKG